ncbi:MAG TPA: hypothetical protein VFQ00_11385 [Terriglobales bacterium]|nr:hypothetical protein [Terriglobales bacterium]
MALPFHSNHDPLRAFRKLLWIVFALALLAAGGTIGFHVIEGWS